MTEEQLQRALCKAAEHLRRKGWQARAEGDGLVCRTPKGLEVAVRNQFVPGDGTKWEEMLTNLAEALLAAAVDEADEDT